MTTTKICVALAAATALLAAAPKPKPDPATALQRSAAVIARAKSLGKAWPVGYQVPATDPARDPWVAMSSAQMAATQFGAAAKRPYAVSANLDWDGDGKLDQAYLANSRDESAVIVRLGGGKGEVVAFRAKGRWDGGQQLAAAGRRIVVEYPESSLVVLSRESGKPAVYYLGDD